MSIVEKSPFSFDYYQRLFLSLNVKIDQTGNINSINISGYDIPYDEMRRVIHSETEKNGTKFYMNDPFFTIDLYHYTTVDAFKSMLEQMNNDKSEDLTFFYDELNRILPELKNELGIKDNCFSNKSA